MRQFHLDGLAPSGAEIFVFGSNLAGIHGAGAALLAAQRYWARPKVGVGRAGQSYAIPTKDCNIQTLDIETITHYVNEFIDYADDHPDLDFYVTRVGCGLAGYTDEQIAPLFFHAPDNCIMPAPWRNWV